MIQRHFEDPRSILTSIQKIPNESKNSRKEYTSNHKNLPRIEKYKMKGNKIRHNIK